MATETVVEIRIHGNSSVPDEDVLELAGIAVGDFVDSAALDAVAARLVTSGLFETVEVHKRYRSLTATDRIALVIVVRERPPRLDRLTFLPILRYEEGYGIAYGLGFSLVDIPGEGGRVSVPVTWGADRRTAFEVERPFGSEAVGRLRGGRVVRPAHASALRGGRPPVRECGGGVERRLAFGVRAGAEAAWEEVVFGELTDRPDAGDCSPGVRQPVRHFPARRREAARRVSSGCRSPGTPRPSSGHAPMHRRSRASADKRSWLRTCCMKAPRRCCRRTSGHCSAAWARCAGGSSARGWAIVCWAASNRASPAAEFSPRDWQDGVPSLLRHGCSRERRIRARPVAEGCRSRRVSGPSGDRQRAVRRRPRSAGRSGGPQRGRLRLLNGPPWPVQAEPSVAR